MIEQYQVLMQLTHIPYMRHNGDPELAAHEADGDKLADAPYPHSIGGGDVRRVWQALGER